MGVPKFARWLIGKYTASIQFTCPDDVHGLYVDFNALIHMQSYSEEDPSVAERPIREKIANICQSLDELVSEVKPERILYIAVDGVAPRAKMMQQRAHRYLNAVGEANGYGFKRKFDKNCISPGTAFMEEVCAGVQGYVEEKFATGNPLWARLTVIFSDANAPCEGENKIITFLRSQVSHPNFCERGAHVVAGLDADLIFLSLSLHLLHIYILRQRRKRQPTKSPQSSQEEKRHEPQFFSLSEGKAKDEAARTSCEYLSIDVVGTGIVTDIYQLCLAKGFKMRVNALGEWEGRLVAPFEEDVSASQPFLVASSSRVIDDFIIMAMILGNDFLPRLPSGLCEDGAMDNALEVYIGEVLPYGYLTLDNREIDLTELTRFYEAYAKIETAKFRFYCFYVGLTNGVPLVAPLGSNVDEFWRAIYYNSSSISKDCIGDACAQYIGMLRFVWRYYTAGISRVSWTRFYPYYHAPFALDLSRFLVENGEALQNVRPLTTLEQQPLDTLTQLLCIVPPTSCAILPVSFRPYMLRPPAHLQESFPSEFKVDFTGAFEKEHLATVMLPLPNVAGIQKLVESLSSSLTDAERRRQKNRDFQLVIARADGGMSDSSEEGGGAESTAADRLTRGNALHRVAVCGNGLVLMPPERSPRDPLLRYYELRETEPLARRSFVYEPLTCTPPMKVDEGKVIQRKTARWISVDWQCADCLLLNFAKNSCCFACGVLYDSHRCWALYGSRGPYDTMIMNPNHKNFIQKYVVPK